MTTTSTAAWRSWPSKDRAGAGRGGACGGRAASGLLVVGVPSQQSGDGSARHTSPRSRRLPSMAGGDVGGASRPRPDVQLQEEPRWAGPGRLSGAVWARAQVFPERGPPGHRPHVAPGPG